MFLFRHIPFIMEASQIFVKRIRHQMKTQLRLCWINSAACRNHREPRGCSCVTHSFTFGFTTHSLQNATEEIYRNKAIQACLPSCNSLQYFLQISLKSSRFFFSEKSIRRPVFARIEYTKSKQVLAFTKVFQSV